MMRQGYGQVLKMNWDTLLKCDFCERGGVGGVREGVVGWGVWLCVGLGDCVEWVCRVFGSWGLWLWVLRECEFRVC